MLVIGASGGVGHVATQVGSLMGAIVVGVCSGQNKDFVLECGASKGSLIFKVTFILVPEEKKKPDLSDNLKNFLELPYMLENCCFVSKYVAGC